MEAIVIRGARLHNLKNITITIPKNQLVVLTGVSGSGKSTLGLDILHQEGQRQYLEALGLVPFGAAKPPVDSIHGLAPSISIDQHFTHHNPRSTVGTLTEVYTYLRVLFARLGRRPCPACGREIPPAFDPVNAGWDGETEGEMAASPGTSFAVTKCPHCGAPVPELSMAYFSFNKPEGACSTCTGLGYVHQADVGRLVDEAKSLEEGAVTGWNATMIQYQRTILQAAARHYGFEFDPARPVKEYSPAQRDLLLYGVGSPQFQHHFPGRAVPATVRQGRFEGVATNLLRRYAERIEDPDYRTKIEENLLISTCPDCGGTRLRPESRVVTVNGRSIIGLAGMALADLGLWLADLPGALSPDERLIAGSILDDLNERISRLVETGAGYLALERSAPSLSAGEVQRLRLAAALGSDLTGVLYVFDEPTVGLHARDTQRLIRLLQRLRDGGNTVLVIEHDLEMIMAADHVIDFGPGAGKAGGQVVAAGTPAEIAAQPGSITGDYLAGRAAIPIPERRRVLNGEAITIRGARHHNLQGVTVRIPLGGLVAVTGVSGSGKSSLVFDILDRALRQKLSGAKETPGEHSALEGWQVLDKVITVDQEHLSRMPRSNAATYADIWTPVREAFAATEAARQRKFTARQFSFNVPGGRCPRCEGTGRLAVYLHFLPEVEVVCPACQGRRFTKDTLEVHYRGMDIAQVLELTVEEALDLFQDVPAACSRLQALMDVGLGYLALGQPAPTLSGGEAQRVKLARELGRRSRGHTLYLLDEPTTGLHLADTARLLGVLQRLVQAGNSVVVVEHNLELIKAADWVIDLGPEGGAAGGQVIAQGTPEEGAASLGSYTGEFLKKVLKG